MSLETAAGLRRVSRPATGSIETDESNLLEKIFCCKNGRNDSDYLVSLLGIESLPGGLLEKPLQLLQSESGTGIGEDISKPLVIDLFCGGFGWTEGFMREGWRSIGFDLEHEPWHGDVPTNTCKVLADVLDLHGSMFRRADCIVASPPCQEYSYMAMPWSRAKAIAAEYRSGVRDVKKLTALFDACFRIQREAIEAAGHFIPLVVENVRGACPWVGRSRWNFGSYHLWGDVPALMPMTKRVAFKGGDRNIGRVNGEHKWNTEFKNPGFRFNGSGKSFQTASVEGLKGVPHRPAGHWTNPSENGVKGFTPNGERLGQNVLGRKGSKSKARKVASAVIAMIPLPLARYIAQIYRPS